MYWNYINDIDTFNTCTLHVIILNLIITSWHIYPGNVKLLFIVKIHQYNFYSRVELGL